MTRSRSSCQQARFERIGRHGDIGRQLTGAAHCDRDHGFVGIIASDQQRGRDRADATRAERHDEHALHAGQQVESRPVELVTRVISREGGDVQDIGALVDHLESLG